MRQELTIRNGGEKEGTFYYSYKDKIQMSIWLKPMQKTKTYIFCVLSENGFALKGTQIDTGDMTVMLVPSKGIVSEDYASFYEILFLSRRIYE